MISLILTVGCITNYQKWKDWKSNNCQPNFRTSVKPDPTKSCGPYKPDYNVNTEESKHLRWNRPTFDQGNHDTIGMIAVNSDGRIAVGTSTNGANHKIPGYSF